MNKNRLYLTGGKRGKLSPPRKWKSHDEGRKRVEHTQGIEISIDNLTIVGKGSYGMMEHLNLSPFVSSYWSTPSQMYMHNFKLENGAFFQIEHKDDGNVRLEFNPNKFKGQENEKYLQDIIRYIKDAEFSRRDIAIDLFNVDIHEYYFLDMGARSQILYLSRSRQLETQYIGSSSSEEMIRVYDKALEREIDDMKWVRVEAQLRREKARAMAYNPFTKIKVVKKYPDNFKELKPTEKLIIKGLMADETGWALLDRKTRKKYKELMSHEAEEIDLKLFFEQKVEELYADAESWLNFSRSETGSVYVKAGTTVLKDLHSFKSKMAEEEKACPLYIGGEKK